MLVFPVSKLLDVLKFPDPADSTQQQAIPTVDVPYVQLRQQQAGSEPGTVDVLLDIVAPKPCWGTLMLFSNGRAISGWSIKEGTWQEAGAFLASQHSGSGSAMGVSSAHATSRAQSSNSTVSSLIVKFTNEHQQGPLHWPITVQLQGSELSQQLSDGKAGLKVKLHVGYLDETPQLAAVEQRMPAWSTLSYRATIFMSSWDF